MKRKNFILSISALSLAGMISPTFASSTTKKKAAFKIAFVSDIHVKPIPAAEQGMKKAFQHINTVTKPDFIVNGGDSIMDALAADKAKTQTQWDLWSSILKENNSLPIYHCIGNHDVWGWQVKDPAIKTDPLYDKRWVLQQHNMPGRFTASPIINGTSLF